MNTFDPMSHPKHGWCPSVSSQEFSYMVVADKTYANGVGAAYYIGDWAQCKLFQLINDMCDKTHLE